MTSDEPREIPASDQAALTREIQKMGMLWAIVDQVFYAIAGQIVIPIPVVGALIGWLLSAWLPGPGDFIGPLLVKRKVRSAVERAARR